MLLTRQPGAGSDHPRRPEIGGTADLGEIESGHLVRG